MLHLILIIVIPSKAKDLLFLWLLLLFQGVSDDQEKSPKAGLTTNASAKEAAGFFAPIIRDDNSQGGYGYINPVTALVFGLNMMKIEASLFWRYTSYGSLAKVKP